MKFLAAVSSSGDFVVLHQGTVFDTAMLSVLKNRKSVSTLKALSQTAEFTAGIYDVYVLFNEEEKKWYITLGQLLINLQFVTNLWSHKCV